MSNIIENIKKVKNASREISLLTEEQRNEVLLTLATLIRKSIADIINANAKDLANMLQNDPMYDRLLLTELRLQAIANDIEGVVNLEAPLGKILENRTMPNGLIIEKICVPLGTVAVIYESRPNVTIDVFTLCFKTGNACVLKGGKEAFNSNKVFVDLIYKALQHHNITTDCVYLLPPNREDTAILLNAVGLVDVCIPRGSQSLIDYVRDNAKIPVIETGAGIVHIYFDSQGDVAIGRNIINNSKTRRVSVCNALDCLLMHKDRLQYLPELIAPLQQSNVEIYADAASYQVLESVYPKQLLLHAKPEDFGREFLDYKMAIKTVASTDAAIQHIMNYTSGHSEAIITENKAAAEQFVREVDAAAVYVNASTAFTDGAQFGMGAEIGISTQKLHARGPMGLDALTTYKWVVHGSGQIRA